MGVLKAARLLSIMHVVPMAALAHVLLPDVVAFDAMLVPGWQAPATCHEATGRNQHAAA